MASVNQILMTLKAKAKPEQLEGMARYGMTGDRRLGVTVPDMRKIAKETVRKDHQLALDLWRTSIPEAMMMASMVDIPEKVTEDQMEAMTALSLSINCPPSEKESGVTLMIPIT